MTDAAFKFLRRATAIWIALCALLIGAIGAEADVAFAGAASFTPEKLRAVLAEQLGEIAASGLSPARADDAAWVLGL